MADSYIQQFFRRTFIRKITMGGSDNTVEYFIYSFRSNFLSGHYDQIGRMFNRYKRDSGDLKSSKLMWWSNIMCVLINTLIWLYFGLRFRLNKDLNWGNVVILLYFIGPSLFGAAGARLRLPVEFILLL